MTRIAFLILIVCLPLACTCGGPRADQPRVQIGTNVFSVEVVRTGAEWSKGLMFREKLGTREGMLFLGTAEKVQSFWMKNTLISLDMIFISKDLKIVSISKNTTPLSEETYSSGDLALHVLEILGGQSDKAGIKVGDTIKFISVSAE